MQLMRLLFTASKQVLLTCGFAGLFVTGCSRHLSPAEEGLRTQTLLLSNSAEPASLDPSLINAWTDANVAYALFEGLTWIDEKTALPIPAAASSWDISPDGLIYNFHLRPDGRWSNGDPLTAGDFAYSFRRVLTPTLGAQNSYMLWPIKNAQAYNSGKITDFSQVGIRVLDPLTLQITLTEPTAYLPALAAHNTWLPLNQSVVEKFGKFDQRDTLWTRPGNLVGNGPFVLKEWTPNSRVVVEKNPLYYDASRVRLNRIEFFPLENRQSEESAFRAGQLSATYSLPRSSIERFRREHPEQLRSDPVLATIYLFFNVNRPPLNNLKLRRALAMAVDRDAIVKNVLLNSCLPAHALTPPDCGGYSPRAGIPTDFAQAKQLLAEAGYPGGRGLPTFDVLSFQSESAIHMLEVIQEQWATQLGVHITITQQEQKTLFANQKNGNFTIAMTGWIADYPDPSSFLGIMVSHGGNNWSGWADPAFDQLIQKAARTIDTSQRLEYFQQAESRLLDQAPLVPLDYETATYLKMPYVRGWEASKLNYHRFKNIWLER